MEDLIIEEKRILWLSCYKAFKFHGTPEAACPWGYEKVNDLCKNCRWLNVERPQVNGREALVVKEICRVDNQALAVTKELSREVKSYLPNEFQYISAPVFPPSGKRIENR